MFGGHKSKPAKQASLKTIINTTMAERASIREHMLKMITAFKKVEVLGAIIDVESK